MSAALLAALATIPGCTVGPTTPRGSSREAPTIAGTAWVLLPGETSPIGFLVRQAGTTYFGGSLERSPAFQGHPGRWHIPDPAVAFIPVGTDALRAIKPGRTTLSIALDGPSDSGTIHVARDPADTRVTARHLTVGGQHGCAESLTGHVSCWGSSWYGEVGDGHIRPGTATLAATPVRSNEPLHATSAGTAHSCALNDVGLALCWGDNALGQVSPGGPGIQPVPTAVPTPRRFRSVSAGGDHTCAIADSGDVMCWGRGFSGVQRLMTPRPLVGISAGYGHTCGLDDQGGAWCRGSGTFGQLGNGSFANSSEFVRVNATEPLTAIAAGSVHTCGVTIGGTALCWGRGLNGALGNGTTADRPGPTVVPLPEPATAVEPGTLHTCALVRGGHAWCWGRNARGQLGVGPPAGASPSLDDLLALRPQPVDTDLRFLELATGLDETTCGLTTAHQVACWGSNLNGAAATGRLELDPVTRRLLYWSPVPARRPPGQ